MRPPGQHLHGHGLRPPRADLLQVPIRLGDVHLPQLDAAGGGEVNGPGPHPGSPAGRPLTAHSRGFQKSMLDAVTRQCR
jgi:hypothetical protein